MKKINLIQSSLFSFFLSHPITLPVFFSFCVDMMSCIRNDVYFFLINSHSYHQIAYMTPYLYKNQEIKKSDRRPEKRKERIG